MKSMKSLLLVFPDQLSKNNKVFERLDEKNLLLMYEPHDSFYEIAHHKHKLVFQISSFRHFIEQIQYKILNMKKYLKNSPNLIDYLSKLAF